LCALPVCPPGRCVRIFERQYFTCEMITGRITSLAMHTRTVLHDPAVRWSLHRFVLVAQVLLGRLGQVPSFYSRANFLDIKILHRSVRWFRDRSSDSARVGDCRPCAGDYSPQCTFRLCCNYVPCLFTKSITSLSYCICVFSIRDGHCLVHQNFRKSMVVLKHIPPLLAVHILLEPEAHIGRNARLWARR
jgi:hypothetical protein